VETLFQESKDRLKLAVDAAEMGTWDFNLLTKELILDKCCKALFDLAPADNLEHNQYLNLISPEDRDAVDEAV